MPEMHNFSVILPAYNEEKNISSVLSRVSGYDVIVVDDGSTDNTTDITRSCGFEPLILNKNSGKAVACMAGIKNSSQELNIFIDSDGQLNPDEIPRFVEALKYADIVIGERRMKDIPLQRRIANMFARKMIKTITGKEFNDVLCGFRGVRKGGFKKLRLEKSSYFFEAEMLIEASRKGLRIKTVPVSVSYKNASGAYRVGSRMPFHKSMQIAFWLMKEAVKKKTGG